MSPSLNPRRRLGSQPAGKTPIRVIRHIRGKGREHQAGRRGGYRRKRGRWQRLCRPGADRAHYRQGPILGERIVGDQRSDGLLVPETVAIHRGAHVNTGGKAFQQIGEMSYAAAPSVVG